MSSSDATIFVIDDDASVLASMKRLLNSVGYTVVGCQSAEAFLAIQDLPPVACIIADVRMPGMTGLELPDALRNRGRTLPIILSSGDADAATAARARDRGVAGFLMKPFGLDELLDQIEGVLGDVEEIQP